MRVKDLAGVILLELVERRLFERLMADPVPRCDVIYCLCKVEADAIHPSPVRGRNDNLARFTSG